MSDKINYSFFIGIFVIILTDNMYNTATEEHFSMNESHELSFNSLIVSKEYEFNTLKQGSELAQQISRYCPFPKRVELGLNEIFINAIEHGNLGLHFDDSNPLFGQEVRFHKIEKMLELPEYLHKKVRVHLQKNPTYILVTVVDEGLGFDPDKYTTKAPKATALPCGRGIYLAKFFSFDNLEYAGRGNIAKCYIHL